MEKRRCSRCKVEKPSELFRKRSDGKYYQTWCKSCERKYYKTSETCLYSRRAHNLKRKYGGNITAKELKEIGPPGICYLCGEKITQEAEYDHVNPRGNGGILSKENIKWTHKRCNHVKWDMTIEEMKVLLKKILIHISR